MQEGSDSLIFRDKMTLIRQFTYLLIKVNFITKPSFVWATADDVKYKRQLHFFCLWEFDDKSRRMSSTTDQKKM